MKIKCELVKIEQKKTKDGKKTFTVYKTVDGQTGKLLDVKFTQAVADVPKQRGTLYGDGNVDWNRQFPCVWVKAIDKFEPWSEPEISDEYRDISGHL